MGLELSTNQQQLSSSENLENIRNPRTLRRKVIEEGKGNFDVVIGYIENFEWTSTGGGFE